MKRGIQIHMFSRETRGEAYFTIDFDAVSQVGEGKDKRARGRRRRGNEVEDVVGLRGDIILSISDYTFKEVGEGGATRDMGSG